MWFIAASLYFLLTLVPPECPEPSTDDDLRLPGLPSVVALRDAFDPCQDLLPICLDPSAAMSPVVFLLLCRGRGPPPNAPRSPSGLLCAVPLPSPPSLAKFKSVDRLCNAISWAFFWARLALLLVHTAYVASMITKITNSVRRLTKILSP